MSKNLNEVFNVNNWFKEKQSGDFVMFYDKQNDVETKLSKSLESNYIKKYGDQGSVQVKRISENKNVMYSRRSDS